MDTPSRREEHVKIIRALADGIDPFTGEQFQPDSPYQHPDVVRALLGLLHALDLALARPSGESRRRRSRPANSGKPWIDGEDEKLAAAFDEGKTVSELARRHERSTGAIRARLHMLGRLDDDGYARYRFATTAAPGPDAARDEDGSKPATASVTSAATAD